MKRFFLAAVCILALSACKQNAGQNTEQAKEPADNTAVQTTAPEEAPKAEEVKLEYLSQDLATFELYGQVQSVTYTEEHVYPVTILFDENGKVTSIQKILSDEEKENAEFSYSSEDGAIKSIQFPSDDPWITYLGYEKGPGFKAPSSYTASNQTGNYTEETYHRDSTGRVVSIDTEEAINFNVVEDNTPLTVEFSDFDEKGNWLKCTQKYGDNTFVKVRTIKYY